MGFRIEFLDVLKVVIEHIPNKRSAYMMGSMRCTFGENKIKKWLTNNKFVSYVQDNWDKAPSPIFRSIGFDEYTDVDINDHAQIRCDLSQPLSSDLYECADLVTDFGTLEHVFDIKTALLNMNKMLRIDGVIVHTSPVNFFGHGYVNFNPQYFTDFYTKNRYKKILFTFQVTIHNPLCIPRITDAWMPFILMRFNLPAGRDWTKFFLRMSTILPLPRNLLLIAAYQKQYETQDYLDPTDSWDLNNPT